VPPRPRRSRPLGRLVPSGRSLLAGFALLAGAAGLYLAALETPLLALRSVDVRGAPPAVEAQVRRALSPLVGSSLVRLDRSDLERRLSSLPMVRRFSYNRDFPHTLRLTIQVERPAGVLRRGADSWLVSARGRILRTLPAGALPELPRIWAPRQTTVEAGATLTGDLLAAAEVAGRVLGSGLHGRVRSVQKSGFLATVALRSGLEIRLGGLDAVPLKLEIAARILATLRRNPPPRSYLDVGVPERPVLGHNLQPAG
jgi:cell division septal protein FtsQ